MNILKNKYFILGNILLLLAVIPITLFVVKRQTDLQSTAAPTTTLSFQPATISTTVGQNFTLDVYVDPNQNIVSIVEMVIKVDPAKLEIVSLEGNEDALPVNYRGPTIDGGSVMLTIGTSNEVQDALQERTKVATLTLKAKAVTTGASTIVSFDKPASQIFSFADQDGDTENVLQDTTSASVSIAQASTTTPSPTIPVGGGTTPSPTVPAGGGAITPTPTAPGGGTGGATPTPTTPAGGGTITPTPTTPGGVGAAGQKPVCTGLFIDRAASGTAPYTLVFTASGTHASGTISKVTFSFGDGVVQEVTQAGGVGTNAVNVQISHTYNNPGSYPASATLTDNTGGVSESTTCKQTITVSAATTGGGTDGTGTGGTESGEDTGTTETIPATGVLETSLAILGIVGVIIVTGVFFLF